MAAARETISPMLRNAGARRLSLEMCQAIGNHLLSPNRKSNNNSVNSSQESLSACKVFKSPSQQRLNLLQQGSSPHQRTPSPLASSPSKLGNHNYRRRGSSGCIPTFSPLLLNKSFYDDNNNDEFREESPTALSPIHKHVNDRRRSSLSAAILQSGYSLFDSATSTSLSTGKGGNGNGIPLLSLPRLGILPASPPDLEFNVTEVLGKGSFGKVVGGTYRGNQVAVKIIRTNSKKHFHSLKSEENALKLLTHPNIAKIYEVFYPSPSSDHAFIVMERLKNGNLLAMLNDLDTQISGADCINFSLEIASAIYYCHSNGILHLDVKPSNILMDFQNHCKLSDFGNSKTKQELILNNNAKFTKLDGTVAYIAPECFRGIIPTEKCDVFSLGITMWQILSRETPYHGETEHSIIYKVVAQAMRPLTMISCHLEKFKSHEILKEFINLYEHCWQQSVESRLEIKSVLQQLSDLQDQECDLE